MIKIYSDRLLTLVCLLMLMGVLVSCEKNDDVNNGKVELLSFGPTGAMHGDTLRFIGNNLNLVTEINFSGSGATVAKSAFVEQTVEIIRLVVPQQTEPGFVTLKTPQGDIVSKTQFNLMVAPVVTTMTAQARPGENVTLSGNFLNWVTSVTFADDKMVDSFVSQSLNQLVVTIPADAQTGTLVLAYGGTESGFLETKDTLRVTLPSISGISPNPIKHGTNATISGSNLDLVKQVLFSGVSNPVTTFITQNATEIVVAVPASTTSGKVSLITPSGISVQSGLDLNVVLPSISSMAPSPVDPGANLTITGTNLDLVDSIAFSNAPAVKSFVSKTTTQIVAKVPTGVLRGKVTLYVTNSTLTVQSTDVLEITGSVPAPTIALPIYNDAVTANWTSTGGWKGAGWGGTADYDNAAPVREGSKSVKISYTGAYGSPLQLGGAKVAIGSYTTFKISIYGATGSGGKKVSLSINGTDAYTITVEEGKWTDYAIPISTLTSSSTITEILVKEYSNTSGHTIYVDALGLN